MIHRGRDRYRTHGGIPHGSTNALAGNLSFYLQSKVDMAVGQWNDQSSNGRNAVQATAGDQAAISADGAGLLFAVGDGDHYDLASQVVISGEEGFTIFLVCAVTSVGSSMCILGLNNTDHFLQFAGGGDNVGIKLAGSTTTITPSTANLWHNNVGKFLITIQREAGDAGSGTLGHLNLWKNGVAVALDSVVENDGDGEFISLGVRNADRFFDGTIYDIAMVEAGQDTAAVRERINAYLTSKHGLS